MRKISLSKKYVPGYLEVERIKKEAERLGEKKGEKRGIENGRKEEKIAMAKAMKKKGYKTEEIAELPKLSIEEVEKL